MTVARLIQTFSKHTEIVEVKDVRDQIVEWGYYNSIAIVGFDKPQTFLLGATIRYVNTAPYGAEIERCIVRFNNNIGIPFQRLVCVKELVHSIDPVDLCISTKSQLSSMLGEVFNHIQTKDVSGLSSHALFEEYAVFQALAILCPEEMREELYDEFHAGKIRTQEIADKFCIPVEYAGFLVLPQWKKYRNRMAGES